MSVAAVVNNRMMTRAFGHNPRCVNQSSNVVLRGEFTSAPPPSVCLLQFVIKEQQRDVWILTFPHLSPSDDSVTTGGAQPSHDVETFHDQTLMTSTQSTLSNGTFVNFLGQRRGAPGCAGHAGRLTAEQVGPHLKSHNGFQY